MSSFLLLSVRRATRIRSRLMESWVRKPTSSSKTPPSHELSCASPIPMAPWRHNRYPPQVTVAQLWRNNASLRRARLPHMPPPTPSTPHMRNAPVTSSCRKATETHPVTSRRRNRWKWRWGVRRRSRRARSRRRKWIWTRNEESVAFFSDVRTTSASWRHSLCSCFPCRRLSHVIVLASRCDTCHVRLTCICHVTDRIWKLCVRFLVMNFESKPTHCSLQVLENYSFYKKHSLPALNFPLYRPPPSPQKQPPKASFLILSLP